MTASHGFHRFNSGHQDLVTAVSYNFYGTRLATASSDHRVKVWDRDNKTGQWNLIDTWQAHDAEVTDIKWNGPFVGEHLGTVGEDGLVRIWEEDIDEALNVGRRFKRVYQQTTVTGAPFTCLDFKNIGTETWLALTTRDGYITICEPEDHDDLSSWRIMWSDYLCRTPSRTEETSFRLCWHHETLPSWPAILAGLDRKSLSLAVAVEDKVRVFRTDRDRKFYGAAILEGAKGLIRDVAWANGSMRGYDVVATASKDGHVRIYEIHTPGAASLSTQGTYDATERKREAEIGSISHPVRSGIGAGLAGGSKGRREDDAGTPGAVQQEVKLVFEIESHNAAPWRVSWSSLGDMLISTGDDGAVRIWKKSNDGKWLEAVEIDATRES